MGLAVPGRVERAISSESGESKDPKDVKLNSFIHHSQVMCHTQGFEW